MLPPRCRWHASTRLTCRHPPRPAAVTCSRARRTCRTCTREAPCVAVAGGTAAATLAIGTAPSADQAPPPPPTPSPPLPPPPSPPPSVALPGRSRQTWRPQRCAPAPAAGSGHSARLPRTSPPPTTPCAPACYPPARTGLLGARGVLVSASPLRARRPPGPPRTPSASPAAAGGGRQSFSGVGFNGGERPSALAAAPFSSAFGGPARDTRTPVSHRCVVHDVTSGGYRARGHGGLRRRRGRKRQQQRAHREENRSLMSLPDAVPLMALPGASCIITVLLHGMSSQVQEASS